MKNLIAQKLPPKECFYSSLRDGKKDRSNGHISNEQYQHLQNIWRVFDFNTFEDFHDHYLKKDVLLLADIFEKFIFTNLKYYGLDPCHYYRIIMGCYVKNDKSRIRKNK